jgi:hypothetical protein
VKVIVAGTRIFSDQEVIYQAIRESGFDITEIVFGASGRVDFWGYHYAYEIGVPHKEFPAAWVTYGKAAGPIRNKQMAEYADALVAVWDGKSPGTKNMIETMKALGKPVFIRKVE